MRGEVILAGFGESSEGTGQIYKFDMSTGISLGLSLKEFCPTDKSANAACTFSSGGRLDGALSGLIALNTSKGALHSYLLGKEKPQQRYFGQDQLISIAVSSDASILAAGNSQGCLYLWHISSGEMLACLESAHMQEINVIKFNSDSALLLSGSADGCVKVWSTIGLLSGAQSPRYTVSDHTASISDAIFGFGVEGACRLFTCSLDGFVRVYDMIDGLCLAQFSFPSPINRLAVNSIESFIFAGSVNGKIYLIDLTTAASSNLSYGDTPAAMFLAGHANPITSMAFSWDDSILVSADQNGVIVIWNIQSRQILRRIDPPSKSPSPVHFLQVVPKASIELAAEPKFNFEAPKRSISTQRALLFLCNPAVATTTTIMNSASAHTKSEENFERSDADLELRHSYMRLFDFVTRQIIK